MALTHTDFRPERILELSAKLSRVAGEKIGEISRVNRAAKMLAINALIVAARAGDSGKGFAIVAEEFKKISTEIDGIAEAMESEVQADLHELSGVGSSVLEQLRGQRLADLALNAIEIIDRNLFERTCDVRWWATDSAVVEAVTKADASSAAHASRRLRIILNAYTVYLDLWICDLSGKVVANGRPDRYPAAPGLSVAATGWFQDALKTTGDGFVACNIERAPALDQALTATYAAPIRANGEANGRVIGVLGVHFDWAPQAQAVVDGVRLSPAEQQTTRVLILDHDGRVLAASDGEGVLTETVKFDASSGQIGNYAVEGLACGYALTPGYETYKGLGWYGCLMQTLSRTKTRQTAQSAGTGVNAECAAL